ncbi:hypothetical protein TWF694_002982 [Orbilia ellipsospora]|uniref:Ankyrin repeat protein n=1 Tax=Orbilia ellipsospora TaxID=2528407 RepID=A0AAV9X1M6_9PEZI
MVSTADSARASLEATLDHVTKEFSKGRSHFTFSGQDQQAHRLEATLKNPGWYDHQLPSMRDISTPYKISQELANDPVRGLIFKRLNCLLAYLDPTEKILPMPSASEFIDASIKLRSVISRYELEIPQNIVQLYKAFDITFDPSQYFETIRPPMVSVSEVAIYNHEIISEISKSKTGIEILNIPTVFGLNFCHFGAKLNLSFQFLGEIASTEKFWSRTIFGMTPLTISIVFENNELFSAILKTIHKRLFHEAGLQGTALAPKDTALDLNWFAELWPDADLLRLFSDRGIGLANNDEFEGFWGVNPLMVAIIAQNTQAVDFLLASPLAATPTIPRRIHSPTRIAILTARLIKIKAKCGNYWMNFPLELLGPAHIALLLQDYHTLGKLLSKGPALRCSQVWCLLGLALCCKDIQCLALFHLLNLSSDEKELHTTLIAMLNFPGARQSYSSTYSFGFHAKDFIPSVSLECSRASIKFLLEDGRDLLGHELPKSFDIHMFEDSSNASIEQPVCDTASNEVNMDDPMDFVDLEEASRILSSPHEASFISALPFIGRDPCPTHEEIHLAGASTSHSHQRRPQEARSIMTKTSRTSSSAKTILEHGGMSLLWPRKYSDRPQSADPSACLS